MEHCHVLERLKVCPLVFPSSSSSSSACPAGQGTKGAASAPASAVVRGWAAGWAPRRRLAAWRKTTWSPPATLVGNPAARREVTAPPPESAATQVRAPVISRGNAPGRHGDTSHRHDRASGRRGNTPGRRGNALDRLGVTSGTRQHGEL